VERSYGGMGAYPGYPMAASYGADWHARYGGGGALFTTGIDAERLKNSTIPAGQFVGPHAAMAPVAPT